MKNIQINHAQKGFTLIELMIVVAIIGILAAIAIPQYQDYIARSQASEAVTLLGGAKTPVEEFILTKGAFPSSDGSKNDGLNADLGIKVSGNYVASIKSDGVDSLTATFNNSDISEALKDKTIVLKRTGTGTWSCISTDLDQKYLPSGCTKS